MNVKKSLNQSESVWAIWNSTGMGHHDNITYDVLPQITDVNDGDSGEAVCDETFVEKLL